MPDFKQMMVVNLQGSKEDNKNVNLLKCLKAQIDNYRELGWADEDVIIISNIDLGIDANVRLMNNPNQKCLTGSKTFAILHAYKTGIVDGPVWLHDLDAWQNVPFDLPEFKDVGAAEYSTPKYNGGSIFYRPQAVDIIEKVIDLINSAGMNKEEPALNKIFRSPEYADRVTLLNYTFNVGCSGYTKRYTQAIKPIRVCHFHPHNRMAWMTHVLDRHKLGESACPRLVDIFRRHGLACE